MHNLDQLVFTGSFTRKLPVTLAVERDVKQQINIDPRKWKKVPRQPLVTNESSFHIITNRIEWFWQSKTQTYLQDFSKELSKESLSQHKSVAFYPRLETIDRQQICTLFQNNKTHSFCKLFHIRFFTGFSTAIIICLSWAYRSSIINRINVQILIL